ncbi:MAG: DegV family protein [Anaerolineales bacterium]|nr:DegV family protein [Anaerolineales bacterium]
MSIRVVTDSTCDLPADLVAEHQITVVPAYVNFGAESLRDGVDITREAFYQRLAAAQPPPTTAAPSPGQFQQAYEHLADQGVTEIISVHLAGTLSNLFAAAQMAAAATERVRVIAVDARQVSLGVGFAALTAARAAAAGHRLADIADMLKHLAQRTRLFAVIDTLTFLRRSGRLNFLEAGLGSLLQIKPILTVHDGQITTERVRTRNQAIQRLVGLLHDQLPVEQMAVLHTAARARAEEFLTEVRHLLPAGPIPVVEATPAIGVHVGPGALGFVCVAAER